MRDDRAQGKRDAAGAHCQTQSPARMCLLADLGEQQCSQRCGLCARHGGAVSVARFRGVAGERMEDVHQDQFLMLLLVMQSQGHHRVGGGKHVHARGLNQFFHSRIDERAIGANLFAGRPADHAPLRARMPRADSFVIGIEQKAEAIVVNAIAGKMRRQQERLEEPGRVRTMPLRRAGIGHRLQHLVFGRDGGRQRVGLGAHRAITRQQRVAAEAGFAGRSIVETSIHRRGAPTCFGATAQAKTSLNQIGSSNGQANAICLEKV